MANDSPKRIVLEVHRSKEPPGAYQLSISELDEKDAGHGYRIYGPKFCACHGSESLVQVVLDKRTADEIRTYLDKVEAPKCPGCAIDGSNALGLHGHLPDCIYNPQRRWDQ